MVAKRTLLRLCAAMFAGAICTVGLFSAPASSIDASNPTIRVGVLKFGTVNWELNVIKHHGLDQENGIELVVVPLTGKNASAVAIQGGAVDAIVTDYIWVSRQRAEQAPYTFVPHSLAVGGLMVRPDSGITSISDLAGKKIGIAGGPVDKSWVLLQAYAKIKLGLDLSATVEPQFGAPPMLNEITMKGDLPAVLNFWHYNARLKASGMNQLIGVSEILPELGIDHPAPLLGWVFSEDWARDNPALITGFLNASLAAKKIIATSDAEWDRLREATRAKDDATFYALRDAYRQGIVTSYSEADIEAARQAFAVLAQYGGEKLVGKSKELSAGTFWSGFSF